MPSYMFASWLHITHSSRNVQVTTCSFLNLTICTMNKLIQKTAKYGDVYLAAITSQKHYFGI